MDFVDGTDAAHLLAGSVAMSVADVVAIVDAIADALDFAHQRGLLHRDVKPANILMTAGDAQRRILLADFGIGREIAHTSGLTATNMTVGTVSYAAPEQLMGESIDGHADQYALGATAFHLLTGRPVFDYSNPAIVISRHLNAAPPPLSDRRPELAALDNVVKRALAKDPADRFTCCADFAQELRAAAERTEGLGLDTGRSARTQVVSGSTVSPTAPTQLAPVPAGLNTPATRSPAPAKPATGSQTLILGGAAGAVALMAVIASIALWPRGVQSNSPAESAIQATSSPTAIPNRPAGLPTAASSSTTPPPSHPSPAPIPAKPPPAAVNIPSRSGSAFVITRSGKTACQIRAGDVGCQVQWTVPTPLQYGAPANGVRVSSSGDWEWVTGDMGDQSYTTLSYGTSYRSLGWTVTPTSDGTTFSNDTTGHGMTVGVQGVRPF